MLHVLETTVIAWMKQIRVRAHSLDFCGYVEEGSHIIINSVYECICIKSNENVYASTFIDIQV